MRWWRRYPVTIIYVASVLIGGLLLAVTEALLS